MRHGLIREFAKENFGPSYYVVPPGQQKTFLPLALIVKEGRTFCGASRRVVLETLDKYVIDDVKVKSDVMILIEDNLERGQEQQMDRTASASSSLGVGIDLNEEIGVTVKRDMHYGELSLGNVQEEYYKDMALRTILRTAKLDKFKMKPYEKKKFYLITNVVYSTKLDISGNREEAETMDASLALPRLEWIKATFSFSSTNKPPPALGRIERSPLLFSYAKVKYNQEIQQFELKQFVGAKHRKEGCGWNKDVVPDWEMRPKAGEKIFCSKEFCVLDDLKRYSESYKNEKLQVVAEIIRQSEKFSLANITIKKFLNLVKMAVSKDGKQILVEAPITRKEKGLLATIPGMTIASRDGATILQVSSCDRAKAQEFIEIFCIFGGKLFIASKKDMKIIAENSQLFGFRNG